MSPINVFLPDKFGLNICAENLKIMLFARKPRKQPENSEFRPKLADFSPKTAHFSPKTAFFE